MSVIGTIFFFICLSFVIVIFGVVLFAVYLKNKMVVFKEVQKEEESYNQEPYVDADFYSIGRDTSSETVDVDEIIDTTYEVVDAKNIDDKKQNSHFPQPES